MCTLTMTYDGDEDDGEDEDGGDGDDEDDDGDDEASSSWPGALVSQSPNRRWGPIKSRPAEPMMAQRR